VEEREKCRCANLLFFDSSDNFAATALGITGVTPAPFRDPTHAIAANALTEEEWLWLFSLPYFIVCGQFLWHKNVIQLFE
jgi:hypothetical protein